MLLDPSVWVAFLTLSFLEIILGIDNVIFITLLANKVPEKSRDKVRKFGLMVALVTRILLLLSLSWVMSLTNPLFNLFSMEISGRDLILFFGGTYLIWKASKEIYENVEVENCHQQVFILNNNMGNLCKDFDKYNQALGFFKKARLAYAELQDFGTENEYTNALNSNINFCMAKIKPRHLGIRKIPTFSQLNLPVEERDGGQDGNFVKFLVSKIKNARSSATK